MTDKSDEAQEYRRRAEELVETASTLGDPKNKVLVLEMARTWIKLAENAGRKRTTSVIYDATGRQAFAPRS
jgi:hypothetical protein